MNIYYSFFVLMFRFFEDIGVGFASQRDYKANTVALFLGMFEFVNFTCLPIDLARGYQILIGLALYGINLAIFLPKDRFEKILMAYKVVPAWHTVLFFSYLILTVVLVVKIKY